MDLILKLWGWSKIANVKLIGFLGIFLLLAGLALAQVEPTDGLTIKIDTDDLQTLNDDDDILDFSGQTITLANKGAAAETVSISTTATTGYTLTPSVTSLSVPASGTATFTLSGKITLNNLNPGNHSNIGTLVITGAGGTSQSFNLNLEMASMLQLNKLRIYVNGNAEDSIKESDDKVSNLYPGDEVEIRFLLENLFDSDYDNGDMEDGTVRAQLDDSDFGDDEVDEDDDFEELNAGDEFGESDSDTPSIKFTIPLDADEDEFTLEISVEAEDGNKADYQIDWNLVLEVEREKDDVRIESATVIPSEMSCVRTAKITATVANFGSDAQKYSAVAFSNAELGIDKKFDFALQSGSSEDNSFTQEYSFTVGDKVTAGTYPIMVRAYYEYNVLDDQTSANLVVKDCVKPAASTTLNASASGITPATGSQQVIASTLNTGTAPATAAASSSAPGTAPNTSGNLISSAVVAQSVEDAHQRDDYIVAGLLAGIVLVFILIIVLLLLLLKR